MRVWQRVRVREFPRHMHCEPYAAIVLSGRYDEVGDAGRFRASSGHVLFHSAFESHLNRFPPSGTELLNIPLPITARTRFGRIADPDSLVRLAERSPRAAAAQLLAEPLEPAEPLIRDFPDLLAAEIRSNPSVNLGSWARSKGIAPSALSRAFGRAYGVPPSGYRARVRGLRAWFAITQTTAPLADIAVGLNFADQSHMTRAIGAITGYPPMHWRANEFKTARNELR